MRLIIILLLSIPIMAQSQGHFLLQSDHFNNIAFNTGLTPGLNWNLAYSRQANLPLLNLRNAYYLEYQRHLYPKSI